MKAHLRFGVTTLLCLGCGVAGPKYDLAIVGGRVIDPATGLDAVRSVGIRGDTVVAITRNDLRGTTTIDAHGLVVAPGFIELHQHAHHPDVYKLNALDGVTAAFELEHGVPDIAAFVDAREGRTPIHFGASASHRSARLEAWDIPLPTSRDGPAAAVPPPSPGPVTQEPPSPERLERILHSLRRQLDAGALGIGVGLEFFPGATRHEVIEVFRLAAEHGVPVFVHARSAGATEPGSSIESLIELIGATAVTGAPLHVLHVNSMCLRQSPLCLRLIAGARARGLDVTAEAYPYTAGMTPINSAFFNPGWQERRGISYTDIELPESGERLTAGMFDQLRQVGEPRRVLIYMNSDSIVDHVMLDSLVLVAGDGIAQIDPSGAVTGHPRVAGTHARVLARYVREQHSMSLHEAVRKMSLLPAMRLESLTPEARRIGRLQVGARADIVVFDLQAVQDRATYRNPIEPSTGVRYLIVAGTPVVKEGAVVEGALPGRALLRQRR